MNVSRMDVETKSRDQRILELTEFYDTSWWNPFNLYPLGRRNMKKKCIQAIVCLLVILLQVLNLILFTLWPLMIILRLPATLLLMIFFSSTKLIFFKQQWNVLIYLWTLDKSAVKDIKDAEIDVELMNLCKVQELVMKSCMQLILQSTNSIALNGHVSKAFVFSLVGTLLDIIFCVYRYGSQYWLSNRKVAREEYKVLENRLVGAKYYGFQDFLYTLVRIVGNKDLHNNLHELQRLIGNQRDINALQAFKESVDNSIDNRIYQLEEDIKREVFNDGSDEDGDIPVEKTWNWTSASWKRILPS